MNLNIFLDEEQRYKYYIVKLLELKQNMFLSQEQLMDTLGVSKYKIDRFLKDIEEDSELLNLKISIAIDPSGEITTRGFTNLVIKKFRLYYLEESKQYQILFELLTGSNQTAESIANKLFISRASIYNELRILKENLKIVGLKIKNLKIIGEEIMVRSFFFSLFNEFYSGLRKPFSNELNHKINEFKHVLLANKNIYPTRVQEYRLELFLGVSFMRIERKQLLIEPILDVSDRELYPYLKLFTNTTSKYKSAQKVEIQNILFFCYTENLINEASEWKINLSVNADVEEISDQFLNQLEKVATLNSDYLQLLRNELFRINRKWLYFHFKESTFIFDPQKSYFQEIYIKCDSLVRSYLDSAMLDNYFEYEEEKIKVYYDYLFLITTVIPTNLIEDVIYVCVDFSHGKFYNEFIQNSIESFKNLNIVFERKITNNTQIYVADFVLEDLVCQQVIWKNPPGPNEWKLFGDIIVDLKGGDP